MRGLEQFASPASHGRRTRSKQLFDQPDGLGARCPICPSQAGERLLALVFTILLVSDRLRLSGASAGGPPHSLECDVLPGRKAHALASLRASLTYP